MGVQLTDKHLRYMNLGERYWDAEVSRLSKDQVEHVSKYLDKFGASVSAGLGLFLFGENSTGKTYIAAALCKEAWSHFRVTSFLTTATELKEAWINDRQLASDETFTQRVSDVRLLVIDDLGKEHRTASGFAETQFGALLRHRARRRKTTIITANMTPKEFSEIYGKSAGELAKECMIPIHLNGDNVREHIAEAAHRFIGE